MLRIDSPWGRLYKVENGLILPSVTTVLKATEKRGFSRKTWSKKLTTKGLSHYEADIYAERWIAAGYPPALAHRHVEAFIEAPMTPEQAVQYMDWKSEHSAQRGNRLHKFLEDLMPIGQVLNWHHCPQTDDVTVQKLVNSLWEGEILQGIKQVHSVEQRLWWYSDGIGYAGTEDICYRTWEDLDFGGDWKSKDPKPYSHTKYDHEYRVQLIAYAGARYARKNMKVDGLHINFCLSNESPAEQTIVTGDECQELWSEWMIRLKAWWATIGTEALQQRYA